MKLLGTKNETHFLFSVGHYDCRTFENLLVDGGQPGLHDFAGYSRFSGEPVWADLPNVTFADLFQDYRFNSKNRKFGLHKLDEVRLLTEDEFPATNSFVWRRDNAIWGSRGKSGMEPLKYILLSSGATDHLINILKYYHDKEMIEESQKQIDLTHAQIYSILNNRGLSISELDEILETGQRMRIKRILSLARQKFSEFQ